MLTVIRHNIYNLATEQDELVFMGSKVGLVLLAEENISLTPACGVLPSLWLSLLLPLFVCCSATKRLLCELRCVVNSIHTQSRFCTKNGV